MELELSAQMLGGTFTEPDGRVWYDCTAEEVELRGSTAVRYPIL